MSTLVATFHTGSRSLRRTWFLFVTFGELLGFFVPAAVGAWTWQLGAATSMFALVLAGAVEGAVLGTSQVIVLGDELPGLSRRDWILATSAGAMVAWLLGMLPSTFRETWQTWPLALTLSLGVTLGALLLVSIGWAQSVVLRRHVPRAWRWVLGSALAWCGGLIVFTAITTPLWHAGQAPVLVAAIGAVGGLAMAATMAWVTGAFLARIVAFEPGYPAVPHEGHNNGSA